jgi:hypothetical protein
MGTIRFDIRESKQLKTWIDEGVSRAAKRAAFATGLRVVNHIVTVLIPAANPPPEFDRHYASGWRAEPTPGGCDVVNNIPYAAVIERGARAENIKIGRKMIDALSEWVRRKGMAADPTPSDPSGTRGVAFAIAMNMKKMGIFNRDGQKGLRILEKASKAAPGFFLAELKTELKREMR